MSKISFVDRIAIKFEDDLKVTSVEKFVAGFKLLDCKFGSFTLKLLHCVILYKCFIKPK